MRQNRAVAESLVASDSEASSNTMSGPREYFGYTRTQFKMKPESLSLTATHARFPSLIRGEYTLAAHAVGGFD
jgi:hypothetical protein